MVAQLTTESFAELLAESGLMPAQKVYELRRHFPVQTSSAEGFISLLVTRGLLTKWQTDKLRLGKHRGFTLGPYRLISHLARGGMSTLYVAEHIDTREKYAIKVLPPSKAGESSYLPRFLREAELASNLNHKNIMRVFDVMTCTDHGQTVHFMVMELLHGRDLFQHVAVQGPMPIRDAAEVVRQAAVGLDHAHQFGLVHRDVKPGNLFLTEDGAVKIVDLGLAAILEGQVESLTRQHDERVLGTADYLAPEQAVDSHLVDSRADIYALGCAFYFILTGRPPFTDGTLAQRILAHQTKHPQDVAEIRSDIPVEIQQLLKAMLVKQRTNRIQTCAEVAARLQSWLLQTVGEEDGSQTPQMVSDNSTLNDRRKLKRILKRIDPCDMPTDSIRASDTRAEKSVAADDEDATDKARDFEEFEPFPPQPDGDTDLPCVTDGDLQIDQRRSLSDLPQNEAAVGLTDRADAGNSCSIANNISQPYNRQTTIATKVIVITGLIILSLIAIAFLYDSVLLRP